MTLDLNKATRILTEYTDPEYPPIFLYDERPTTGHFHGPLRERVIADIGPIRFLVNTDGAFFQYEEGSVWLDPRAGEAFARSLTKAVAIARRIELECLIVDLSTLREGAEKV
jgi:hypothetical protein